MNLLKKLFGAKDHGDTSRREQVDWEQLPTISAIALLDADAFSRAPVILHGFLGLRDVLCQTTKSLFPDDESEVINDLIALKCQFIASADTSVGLTMANLDPATLSFCEENRIEMNDSDSEGRGLSLHYSSMFPHAWGEFHIILNANLNKSHWKRIYSVIPNHVGYPVVLAIGKSETGQYVFALLHRQVVKAYDLISMDAGPSFNDFCNGIFARAKRAKIRVELVRLSEVLGE